MKGLKRMALLPTVLLLAIVLISACLPATPTSAPVPPSGQAPLATQPVKENDFNEGQISLDRNFYVIIDGSRSMESAQYAGSFSQRIDAAKWAAEEFIIKSVSPDVNLGLYVFDEGGDRERVPLGKNNRREIVAVIYTIRASGGTPLNSAIKTGVKALVKQRNLQLGYGEFYVVVVTDGEATDGQMGKSVSYANENGIPIITIGFGLKSDHPLKKDSLSYRNATSPEELRKALEETQSESDYYDAATFQK